MAVKKRKVAKKAAKKRTAKKSVKARVAKKKSAPAKKVAPKVLPKTLETAKKHYTKSCMQKVISDCVGITKKQAGMTLEMLGKIIDCHIRQGGVGSIKIEGLMKVQKINKPAKKARKGVNPFTGAEMMFKAKPAHNVVKVRALKKLKEMV